MAIRGDDILFSNFHYNPENYYFLYVGDLKTYTLNHFVQETLRRRVTSRAVSFIAIVPDVCLQYNYSNIIVINPVANREMIRDHTFSSSGKSPRLSCRISSHEFMTAVSTSFAIHELIEQILTNQNQLYINMYESVIEMTLDRLDRVSILGPDKHVAHRYNNKVVQFKELRGVVPLIPGETCLGAQKLYERTASLRPQWRDGIFVSGAFSAAGANSSITYSQEDVLSHFTEEDEEYLITQYIPHDLDPTVLAVVANEDEVYVAGIADQNIVGGNRFVGSYFPSRVSEKQAAELKEYTIGVGKLLGKSGYRGIFGCDYLIDRNGEVRFLEINARKQGTTLEFCFTLEQTLPEGAPSLPELEYFAVTEGRFPPQTVEMRENIRSIHWGTYNHKVADERVTIGYIPQNPYEREAFKKIARKELVKDFAILEHLGTNLKVMPGTFLARVVSVARSREDVEEGLCQGVGFIQRQYRKHKMYNQSDIMQDKTVLSRFDSYTRELLESLGSPPDGSSSLTPIEVDEIKKLYQTAKDDELTGPIVQLFRQLVEWKTEKGTRLEDFGLGLPELINLAEKHQKIDEHMVSVGGRLTQALPIASDANSRVEEYLATKSELAPSGIDLWEKIQENTLKIQSVLKISDEQWNSFSGQIQNAVDSVETLAKLVDLPTQTLESIAKVTKSYRMRLTPYYTSLIMPGVVNDPVMLQAIPTGEMIDNAGIEIPPVAADHSPARLIDQFYPRVVTIKATNMCAMYCTHCLRLAHIGKRDKVYAKTAYQEALEYIRNNERIRDVLITGGDAFVLPNSILKWLLEELDTIPHVRMKRLGSRVPVTVPMRIDNELLDILEASNDKKPIRVVTQINTAQEITPVSRENFKQLSKRSATVLNQAVFLKGINDSRVKMWQLCETVHESYVRPYYLFNCSYRNPQFSHFRVPLEVGRDIVESMYGNISGDAIPRYIATAGGKIPLHRSNVVEKDGSDYVLKKPWSGEEVRYPDADPSVYENESFAFKD